MAKRDPFGARQRDFQFWFAVVRSGASKALLVQLITEPFRSGGSLWFT